MRATGRGPIGSIRYCWRIEQHRGGRSIAPPEMACVLAPGGTLLIADIASFASAPRAAARSATSRKRGRKKSGARRFNQS